MARRIAARRYANALFSLCREQGAIDAVHADLTRLAGLLETSEDWRFFVTEPSGRKDVRAGAIRELLHNRAHTITARFIGLLDHKSRINILPTMVEEWTALYDQHQGITRARVSSARPLKPDQKETLMARISKRLDRKVILEEDVDPSLIGGIKLFIGDQVLDYSIDTMLLQLSKKLTYG